MIFEKFRQPITKKRKMGSGVEAEASWRRGREPEDPPKYSSPHKSEKGKGFLVRDLADAAPAKRRDRDAREGQINWSLSVQG